MDKELKRDAMMLEAELAMYQQQTEMREDADKKKWGGVNMIGNAVSMLFGG